MAKLIDPSEVSFVDIYKLMIGLIGPRPIGWISTVSKEGKPNLAPYSFFNMVSNNPPILAYSPALSRDRKRKDSLVNAKETKCFVHNLVTPDLVKPMVQSSFEYERGESEFEKVGLTPIDSNKVKAPRVKEAAVNIECQLMQVISFGDQPTNGQLVLGEVVAIHINDESILAEDGFVKTDKLTLVGRLGRGDYTQTKDLLTIPRPKSGKELL